jgi:hypothetical protein
LVKGNARAIKEEASRHTAGHCAVAFLDQLGAETICSEDPTIIEQLMINARVAFCRGPIRMPYFHNRLVAADLIGFSPTDVAQRIVSDLRWNIPPPGMQTPAFAATYRPLVPMKEAADLL